MENLQNYTTVELVAKLENLNLCLEMDLNMDGSGELGHIIHRNYEPFFDSLNEELNKRGYYEEEELGVEELPF